jgi:hypothetical protein
MELFTAVRLIESGIEKNAGAQVWCDLGAGQGLFTRALSTLLPEDSVIYAVDKDAASLNKTAVDGNTKLHKVNANFISWDHEHPLMNGVLMANALHFVPDRLIFVQRLLKKMTPDGRLLLVEYDLEKPNPWVPFPLSKSALKVFSGQAGFTTVTFLDEVPSVYNQSVIYSAVLRR